MSHRKKSHAPKKGHRSKHFTETATGRYETNLKKALRAGDTKTVKAMTQSK